MGPATTAGLMPKIASGIISHGPNNHHHSLPILLLLSCFVNSLITVGGFQSLGIFSEENGLDSSNSNNYNNFDQQLEESNEAIEGNDDAVLDNLPFLNGRQELVDPLRNNEIYILEDKDYPKSLFEHYPGVGQVSGIAALPSGDVAIVHRADREWNDMSFSGNFSVVNWGQAQDNLLKNDTIMIIDRENGGAVTTFGANLFYLPHSVASDNFGNLWITDVGRHQVMRLPTSMMQFDQTPSSSNKAPDSSSNHQHQHQRRRRWLPGNLTRIWPDIILGEAFVPGKDQRHFCQPSEVEVSSDGRLVFVADGYCNQRIMVFSGISGEFVGSFGEQQDMSVVHSISLIEERNLLCAADRENGRILCFRAGLDGNLDRLGELMLAINYPLGRVFAIQAISPNHLLVSSNQPGTSRFDLAALNPFTSELKQTWTSSDLLAPHSLARTMDGQFVYAADISRDAYRKVFKFNVIRRRM